jgi:hypothetical protein
MRTIDIEGRPDLAEGFVLAMLVLVFPTAGLAGWYAAQVDSTLRRVLIADFAVVVILLGAVFGGPTARIPVNLMIWSAAIGSVLALTATGVGSIVGWAAELTLTNLAYAAGMFVRALPVVLLTFLVFFNTYVWLMTSLISRGRLWLGMGFLFLVAAALSTAPPSAPAPAPCLPPSAPTSIPTFRSAPFPLVANNSFRSPPPSAPARRSS